MKFSSDLRHDIHRIAIFDGSAVKQLSRKTRFGVTNSNARFLSAIMRDQVGEAVVIDVLEMAAGLVRRGSAVRAERERGHVHVDHVENVTAENRHGNCCW